MKNTLLFLLLCIGFSASAQYSNPYRMTFDGVNYFITNKGNGTVSKLNSTFAHSTVISGLHSPNDIFFGSVAGNSAIVVIDSNKLKLFSPTTYGSMLTIAISGATEAHDGVFNPSNPNEFYISDRAGNKIIKGSIGSAPFYAITFSTLTTNISKPAGMIFNSQGKLLVVTDTTDSEVYEINTSTGAKTLKLSTTKDNFNDIAQDGQGNYYITCWGDDNLYRYSPSFTNAYVIATFNNPSGLLSNLSYDYLGICCHNCQKVEFKFYHLFSPLADIYTCVADTFYADFTPSYQGIGTYNSGNQFVVEMSDSNGSFSNAIKIGGITSATPPNSIKAAVPSGTYASSGYKYRLASTSPTVLSYFEKELNILTSPSAYISDDDTARTCQGINVQVGKSPQQNVTYHWTPGHLFSDSTSAQPELNTNNTGTFGIQLFVKDTFTGCAATSHSYFSVGSELAISGLSDTLTMCAGDTISVGVNPKPYIFSWTGSGEITSNSISNPRFFGTSDVQLNVTFSDSSSTCFGMDSTYIKVNPIPPIEITQDVKTYCFGDTITFINSTADDYLFNYTTANTLTPLRISDDTLQYLGDNAGTYFYQLRISDANTGCYKDLGNAYIVFEEVPKPIIAKNADSSNLILNFNYKGEYVWHLLDDYTSRDSVVKTSINSIANPEKINRFNKIWVEVKDSNGCSATSDTFNLKRTLGISNVDQLFSVYPNPSNGKIAIECAQPISKISLFDLTGKAVYFILNPNPYNIQLPSIKGMYILEVVMDSGIGHKTLILN